MGIEIIFKIAAIGIVVAIIAQVLKQAGKDEIATLTTLAGLIVVLFMIVDMVSELFSTVQNLFNLY
ncbi:MAG: stage III sporulation protein AC [Clostridia bacterium]|nr:stage III sporulation protein AC [Clostridia bacterium]